MSKEIIDKINNNLIMLVEGFDDAERDYGYDMANEKHYVSELIELVKNLSLSGVMQCKIMGNKINELRKALNDYESKGAIVVGFKESTEFKKNEEINGWATSVPTDKTTIVVDIKW